MASFQHGPTIDGSLPAYEPNSLAEKMLMNFLARKQEAIGQLPSRKRNKMEELICTPPTAPGVYVIRVEETFKIGHTTNFAKRIESLKVGSPKEMTLEIFLETRDRLQAKRLENALHNTFEHKNVRGEWFALDDDDLNFIKYYQENMGQMPVRDQDTIDVKSFQERQRNIVINAIKNATKTLKRRTFVDKDMYEAVREDTGLTYSAWQGYLSILAHEKALYYSGSYVRVPMDFFGPEDL